MRRWLLLLKEARPSSSSSSSSSQMHLSVNHAGCVAGSAVVVETAQQQLSKTVLASATRAHCCMCRLNATSLVHNHVIGGTVPNLYVGCEGMSVVLSLCVCAAVPPSMLAVLLYCRAQHAMLSKCVIHSAALSVGQGLVSPSKAGPHTLPGPVPQGLYTVCNSTDLTCDE